MLRKRSRFSIFVVVFVMLIGMFFGGLTSYFYYSSTEKLWEGILAGLVFSFSLSFFYLRFLRKTILSGRRWKSILFGGTGIAILCGIACTILVHVSVLGVKIVQEDQSPMDYLTSSLSFIIWGICLAIGAGAGAIAGFICSGIYAILIRKELS